MKNAWITGALGAGCITLASMAAVAADAAPATQPEHDLVQVRRDQQCSSIGAVFYRLAEQRAGGADEKTATKRVAEWSAGLSQTGSHYVRKNGEAIGEAAHLVYRLTDLNSLSLAAFGKDSCLLQFAFEHDEDRKTAGMVKLIGAAVDCQKKNPGEVANGALTQCIRVAEESLVEQLKAARIDIKR